MMFPTWEEATAGITDSRFVGHPKHTDYYIKAVRAGARIMYDEMYIMLQLKLEQVEETKP